MLLRARQLRKFSDLQKVRQARQFEDLGPLGPEKLSGKQIKDWSASLQLIDWTVKSETKREVMQKKFEFKDFRRAWAFMRMTAVAADKLDHHPEWFNVYNRVEVLLSTHTVNGLTVKDMLLAEAMVGFCIN
jgi:4a-hydroxytetrahydrobiopterin dehydratase